MIVVGDVHGQFNMLMRLMDKLPQTINICFVGDLIDRGPDSRKVIEFVRKNNYNCVMGNHEDLISRDYSLWMYNGGTQTLKSYGVNYKEFLELDDAKWLNELPILTEWNEYIISHSFAYKGLNTPEEDLLWGRVFPRPIKGSRFKSIFGHSPVKNAKRHYNMHWNIDTGAVYGNKLSAIDLTDESIYFVEYDKKEDINLL